jgi:CRISPR-associated endonuclease/helicase Cas3
MIVYYAKPDQTYREHLEAVYTAWEETVEAKRYLIGRLAHQYNFSVQRFLEGSLLTVVLHDIGKMIIPFQQMMLAKRNNTKFNLRQNYRHEIASFIFVFAGYAELQKRSSFSSWPIEALAVVGHHKSLDPDFRSFEREKKRETPIVYEDGIQEALQFAEEIFQRKNWSFPTLTDQYAKENGLQCLYNFIWNATPKLAKIEETVRTRDLYWLMKGILYYADWHGSGKAKVNYYVTATEDTIVKTIDQRCLTKKIIFKGLTSFQQEIAIQSGHTIAVAPTGSGKTEASILWALKNSLEMGGTKVIYLLPTMATANSIWDRLCQFFGKENVGLTHSSASFMFDTEIDDEMEDWGNRRNLLFDQSFIRPVTVGTVDQLLTVGFNAGRWVLKEINAANAVIIMDEIHAYDGWTLGLIVATIRHFEKFGTRFLLMSATMPNNLIEIFQKELPNVAVIKDIALLNAKRSKYFTKDKFIEEDRDEIRKAVQSGHKVLVVVNTIEKCQQLAKDLEDLNPICYHARFIFKDRKTIETNIENAQLVIATQIVEVSLDINFDWLFTECAPPDAIAQRAGRINRYRDPNRDSRIYIYQADVKSEKIYNPINNTELLDKTFKEFQRLSCDITEQDLLTIIENVYKDYPYENREGFNDALNQYQLSQKNRLAIFDNCAKDDELEVTRMSKYETVSVIPYCFYDEVVKLLPKDRQLYELKVPYWYLAKDQNKKLRNGILFCDIKYHQKLGGILQPDNRGIFCS